MTLLPETEATTATAPADSPAPAPKKSYRRPKVNRQSVKRARSALEVLVSVGKLKARSPAGRRLRQIEREWRKRMGNVDGVTASALRAAASQQLLLERIDDFIHAELPSPVNKGKRGLHPVVRERQAIAAALFEQLEYLGLSKPQPHHKAKDDFWANIAERMDEGRQRAEDPFWRDASWLDEPEPVEPRQAIDRIDAVDAEPTSPEPQPELIPAGEVLPRELQDVTPEPVPQLEYAPSHSVSRILADDSTSRTYDEHEQFRQWYAQLGGGG